MSANNPTKAEVEYLAGLSSAGHDETAPALARMVLFLNARIALGTAIEDIRISGGGGMAHDKLIAALDVANTADRRAQAALEKFGQTFGDDWTY